MTEWNDIIKSLRPVTWEEIKRFYKVGRNEILPDDWEEAFCYAFSKSRNPYWIDLLATGYKAAQAKYQSK